MTAKWSAALFIAMATLYLGLICRSGACCWCQSSSSSSWLMTADHILDPVRVPAQLGVDRRDEWVAAAPAHPLHTL